MRRNDRNPRSILGPRATWFGRRVVAGGEYLRVMGAAQLCENGNDQDPHLAPMCSRLDFIDPELLRLASGGPTRQDTVG